MVNDDGAREQLLALGVRTVPVVARGTQFVFAQNLEDVAVFVGLAGSGHQLLPPERLIVQWLKVLGAAQLAIGQMPEARMDERVIDNRDRSIRSLSHHIFRIAEAFLECVVDGDEYTAAHAAAENPDGPRLNRHEIAGYGGGAMIRLESWWNGRADQSCRQRVKTFFGEQTIHMLFERSVWHSAQHARQLVAVLERFGIEPEHRLGPAELDGLPLPEGLWE